MVSAANPLTRELKMALVLGLYDTANLLSSGKHRNWQQTHSQGGYSWRAERLSGGAVNNGRHLRRSTLITGRLGEYRTGHDDRL